MTDGYRPSARLRVACFVIVRGVYKTRGDSPSNEWIDNQTSLLILSYKPRFLIY